jgi:hypothetical protein
MKHFDDQDALILKIVEKLEARERENTAWRTHKEAGLRRHANSLYWPFREV